MPLPIPTNIATGFGDAVGCAYRQDHDQLIVVDAGAGTITAVNTHTHVKTLLGSGYHGLTDIALSADGVHAYVSDSPGTLFRVNLSSANRAAAVTVATGLSGVDQIALDETRGVIYVTEFNAARIQRINLATGVGTPVASVGNPRGVLVTGDGHFLYVSGDTNTITRFDLVNNTNVVVASGLSAPRHLTWADAGETVILFPQPNPAGTVLKLDLTLTPPSVTAITGTTPSAPYSVAVLSPERLLITCAQIISQVNLTDSVYTPGGNIFLGIGFVPADSTHLPGGYADTTMDPTYFFQIKNAPFGGTLPLMINHERARTVLGANFYKVIVDGPMVPSVEVRQPFTDYLWSVPLNRFEAIATTPIDGYYPIRSAGQIWLNYWLGLLLDTSGQPNAPNTITIKLFSARDPATEIGSSIDPGRRATVMIDNTVPTARIERILHGGLVVDTCAIVTTPPPTFTFGVTAEAPQHLRGWSLIALWGDNRSKAVSSDDYSNHTASPVWTGLHDVIVPPPGPAPWDAFQAGDSTSTHCAHTFILSAWDRVINGWGYVHGEATYHKSITIMI